MSKPASSASCVLYQLDALCKGEEIMYHPSSELISFNWVYGTQVLTHLLTHHAERQALLDEAHQRSPNVLKKYCIHHPLLGHALKIDSLSSDREFRSSIICLKWRWNQSNLSIHSSCHNAPSTNPIPLANPNSPFITTIIPPTVIQPPKSHWRVRWATSSCLTMEK